MEFWENNGQVKRPLIKKKINKQIKSKWKLSTTTNLDLVN